jgi:glycosyltransferase involved in cell wall biosynthesis
MQLLFWLSLLGASYSYLIYPFVLLLLPRRQSESTNVSSTRPIISVIITARNEENRIEQKIRNTLTIDYAVDKREILVASDASSDRTDEIVRQYEKEGVRLVRADERRGKEYAQRLAIRQSNGEILVFTDVGTSIPAGAVSLMVAKFDDPKVGAVSSEDRVITRQGTATGEGLYVRYEMWLRALESSRSTLVGLSGSFFAARREVCQDWDVQSPSDFNTALNCRRLGYVAVSDFEIVGYYQEIKNEIREYQRKVRTVVRGIAAISKSSQVLNPLKFGLFAFQVWSHKIFRWLVPWFLILMFATSVIARQQYFYLGVLIAQLCFYGLAAAACFSARLRASTLFKIPFFFVQANAAIAHAMLTVLVGRRITTWNPSER